MAVESLAEQTFDRPRQRGIRPQGLAVMAVLVALGLGFGAGFYRYEQPRVVARVESELAGAPTRPEGRVQHWVFFGAPQIHHAVHQARISARQPWFVAYTVRDPAGGAPAVWGFPVAELEPEDIVADGMRVEVRLPRPRLLARERLGGALASYVPAFGPKVEVDPDEQIVACVERQLADLAAALAKDIPGATIDVVVRAE